MLRPIQVDAAVFNASGSEVLDPVAEIDVTARLSALGTGYFKIKGQMPVSKNEAINFFTGQILSAELPDPFIFSATN